MKKFGKMLLLFLAIGALALTLMACAEDEEKAETEIEYEDENFVYEIKDGKAIVYAYKGKGENVTIPSTFGGKSVTKIDESAFEGRDFIKSVAR